MGQTATFLQFSGTALILKATCNQSLSAALPFLNLFFLLSTSPQNNYPSLMVLKPYIFCIDIMNIPKTFLQSLLHIHLSYSKPPSSFFHFIAISTSFSLYTSLYSCASIIYGSLSKTLPFLHYLFDTVIQ